MKTLQHELAVVGDVFNLAPEAGVDIDRVLREQREQLSRECAAREFQQRMQRRFEQCPGVIGFDLPQSAGGNGRIVVEPARVGEAMAWLKRRFVVSENIALSSENSLAIDVAERAVRRAGCARSKRNRFGEVEQFTFALVGGGWE